MTLNRWWWWYYTSLLNFISVSENQFDRCRFFWMLWSTNNLLVNIVLRITLVMPCLQMFSNLWFVTGAIVCSFNVEVTRALFRFLANSHIPEYYFSCAIRLNFGLCADLLVFILLLLLLLLLLKLRLNWRYRYQCGKLGWFGSV